MRFHRRLGGVGHLRELAENDHYRLPRGQPAVQPLVVSESVTNNGRDEIDYSG